MKKERVISFVTVVCIKITLLIMITMCLVLALEITRVLSESAAESATPKKLA